ncbi:hypothetical protein F511_47376 [Dorcoceras hygrometricum]|uniref:Uncharacterized protein n=1 Tax=Dorcoceras hygrometricum TaxID=472368 RepID=A0A2Z6ZRS1_9LAMI|nr:hypothetical protein F511_47376 [Dorcoceras hygrometricum]
MPGGRLAPLDASRNLAAAAGRRWAKLLDVMHAAGRRLAAGAPRLLAHDRRWSAQPVAHEAWRWHADGRAGATRWCAAAAAFFLWWRRRRRRPPLRRVSGDVVTAGLNSSRVWFGPVPGSP